MLFCRDLFCLLNEAFKWVGIELGVVLALEKRAVSYCV